MSCCVCGAEDFEEGWQRWDDHPARRQWHVMKDLGSGAMSQVGPRPCGRTCAGSAARRRAASGAAVWAWRRRCARRVGRFLGSERVLPPAGSQVVLAQNIQTGEMAALKVVFLESPTVADDPEHLALLQRWVWHSALPSSQPAI